MQDLGDIRPEKVDEVAYKEFTLAKSFREAQVDPKNAETIMSNFCILKIQLLKIRYA